MPELLGIAAKADFAGARVRSLMPPRPAWIEAEVAAAPTISAASISSIDGLSELERETVELPRHLRACAGTCNSRKRP